MPTIEPIDDQLRRYLKSIIPPFRAVTDPKAWRKKAAQLRREALAKVYLRGYSPKLISARPRVVWGEVLRPHPAYVVRKLRYEAYPDYWIPALLYEPARLTGPAPVVLNPNGHHAGGKSVVYKQARCINLARRGMIALNFEFLGMSELGGEAPHNNFARLDATGLAGVGLFYLAMKKGLDVLLARPRADKRRVAMTGLSGGGWQTIVLSALDERITLTVPVAGYTGVAARVDVRADIGDYEQIPPDLTTVLDYQNMTAMLAPRPALLILNGADDCCFRTERARPIIYEPVLPVYRAFGAEGRFQTYNNLVPGTHNYDLDNRQRFYKFLNEQWGRHDPETDVHDEKEYFTEDELSVGLPANQASYVSIALSRARALAAKRKMPKTAAQKAALRRNLAEVLRLPAYKAAAKTAGRVQNVETLRLRVGPWELPGAKVRWSQAESVQLVIHDGGHMGYMKTQKPGANSGTAFVVDILGTGESAGNAQLKLILEGAGWRLLGIQVAQILAAADYVARAGRAKKIALVGCGLNSSFAALAAAALHPEKFSSLTNHGEIKTLEHLIERAVPYEQAQALWCRDLLTLADAQDLRALLDGVAYSRPDRCVLTQ